MGDGSRIMSMQIEKKKKKNLLACTDSHALTIHTAHGCISIMYVLFFTQVM